MHKYNLASSIRGFRLSLMVIPLCFYTIEIQAVAVKGLNINIAKEEAMAVEGDEVKESATDLRRILTLHDFLALDLDYTDLTLVNKDDNIAVVYTYDTDDADSYDLLNEIDEQIINLSKNTSYLQQRKKFNCSRHTGEKLLAKLNYRQYNKVNNYVNTNGQFYDSVSLARDAKAIVEAEGNSWARSRTVVFCVALRDKWGYCKKFAFHNGEKIMSKDMFERAETLGYDIIQTEQSHAEVQFLQFLRRRNQDRPGWYTHIIYASLMKRSKEAVC